MRLQEGGYRKNVYTTGVPKRDVPKVTPISLSKKVPVFFNPQSFYRTLIPIAYLSHNGEGYVTLDSYVLATRTATNGVLTERYFLPNGKHIEKRTIERYRLETELYKIIVESPKTENSLKETITSREKIDDDTFQKVLLNVLRKRFARVEAKTDGAEVVAPLSFLLRSIGNSGDPQRREKNERYEAKLKSMGKFAHSY